jgi:hypothetical protein
VAVTFRISCSNPTLIRGRLLSLIPGNINNPEEWKREARALFDAIDLDKDSILRKDELLKAFPHFDAKTADLLFEEFDTDGDGGLSFDELWGMMECIADGSVREQDLKISRSLSLKPTIQSKSSREVERGSSSPGDS